MKVSGKLIEIFETVKVKDSFQKREFVIEYATNPKYPELIKFELVQDKCAQLDKFSVGQDVGVDFDLRGRKWTDQKGVVRYFTTLQAWRLSAASAGGDAGDEGNPPDVDTEDFSGGKDEGLPF